MERHGLTAIPVSREALDVNKDVSVLLRLTQEEREAWRKAAEAEQMTLSQWIRRRCNGLPAIAPTTIGEAVVAGYTGPTMLVRGELVPVSPEARRKFADDVVDATPKRKASKRKGRSR